MTRIFERPAIPIILLAVLSAYLFFFRLGGTALTDPDETFYAETAKEMVERGEWITPYIYDKPQFEKPILFYWLLEASFKALGPSEFAARLPSAAFGFIGIIALYLFGSSLFNRKAGFFSAAILATSVEYITLSRACVTDMVLGTFMMLGFAFFYLGHMKGRRGFYPLSAAAFALATLTKGPIAILLAGLIILIWCVLTKEYGIFKDAAAIAWSFLVFIVIALPWYLAAYKLHPGELVSSFFGFHNVTRFLEAEHKIGSQFYYNIPVVLFGLFPWSAFLPLALWRAFKNARAKQPLTPNPRPQAPGFVFLLTWFFVIFIFFTISSTKLPTYIFPCFPALALMIGALWDDFLNSATVPAIFRGMRFSYYLLMAAVVAASAGIFIFIRRDAEYNWILTKSLVSGAVLASGMALAFSAFIWRRFAASFFFIIYSVAIFIYPLNSLILPAVEIYETSKKISQEALSRMAPDEEIGCERDYLAGVAFYTGKTPVNIDRHHLLTQFLNSGKRVWCVMKEKNFHQLYDLDDKPFYNKPSYLVYRLGKKCIFTNRVPADGAYILQREGRKR